MFSYMYQISIKFPFLITFNKRISAAFGETLNLQAISLAINEIRILFSGSFIPTDLNFVIAISFCL